MKKTPTLLLLAFASLWAIGPEVRGQNVDPPETVTVKSGALTLRALLWRPRGGGPFPAVMFNHGSYSAGDPLGSGDAPALGTVFARHGYVFLFLCRQGVGLSAAQGTAGGDLMARALVAEGQAGRNRVQLQLLEIEELNEAFAGLSVLRARPEVNVRRIAVAGHSFGGSLSLFMADRDPTLRAVVTFGGAAGSWEQSPELRARLLAALSRTPAPVFFIHAANDYSIAPGKALAAEMQRLTKRYALKIYPAFGRSTREGHDFLFRNVGTWESDVFSFLEQSLQP
jgi:dienelactone hydrolase